MSFKAMGSVLILCFSFMSLSSHAGITLSGTRLIFNGNKNEAVMTVTNPDKTSYLIQSWVSLDDKKSSEFIVTPPLFRMDGNSSNALRIVLAKDNLPQDRESLFWLNVKAIPPSDPNAKDALLIALNTKIKLIYRPKSLLSQDAGSAYQKLTFKIDSNNQTLIATNPTAYYINLSTLTYNGEQISDAGIVAPFSEATWKIKPATAHNKVQWRAINDFGGMTAIEAKQID